MFARVFVLMSVVLVVGGAWLAGFDANQLQQAIHNFVISLFALLYLGAYGAVLRLGGWQALLRAPIFLTAGTLGACCLLAAWGLESCGILPCAWLTVTGMALITMAELCHAAFGWARDVVIAWWRAKLDLFFHEEKTSSSAGGTSNSPAKDVAEG